MRETTLRTALGPVKALPRSEEARLKADQITLGLKSIAEAHVDFYRKIARLRREEAKEGASAHVTRSAVPLRSGI